MTEEDVLSLIRQDPWMIDILRAAEKINLKDWLIGAGFLRNKVWDYLHGRQKEKVDTADIDLIYYDPEGNDQKTDETLSKKLKKETGINWEIVNECYAHKWNNLPPYASAYDALSQWPETATAVGVKIENGQLRIIAPYGIGDLVNLIIRPSPKFVVEEAKIGVDGPKRVKERIVQKKWLEKYPKLTFHD